MPNWTDDAELMDQGRWNEDYGALALAMFRAEPDSFLVDPDRLGVYQKLLYDSLPADAVKVLDFGCGQGELSIAMALRGATVTGIDIGEDLIELSKLRAKHNGVVCEFRVGSIHDLPFDDDSFDLVIGAEILHHLPVAAAAKAFSEAHRVLRPGGKACFIEPLENSRAFDMVQSLIPVGSPTDSQYRPSILQRKKWANYQRTLDERQLTDAELEAVARQYSAMTRRYHGLVSRLTRIVPSDRASRIFDAVDHYLTHARSPVKRYSRQVLVHLTK